jgi:ribonucleoside-diphosphate reductase alpha chain
MRWLASQFVEDTDFLEEQEILTSEVRSRKEAEESGIGKTNGNGNGNGNGHHAPDSGGSAVPAAKALTDNPPVIPAKVQVSAGAAELGPACDQCGGIMQRTGSCYTCSSCGNNTGCG